MSAQRDVAATRHVRLLAALLDHADPPWRAGELPPLGHWLLFPPDARQSDLGADGHPRRDADGLPRRMWAGGRVRFLAPISLDRTVERETSQIAAHDRQGRSGRMRFVTLRHRLSVDGTPCIEEEQDIVYREAASGSAVVPPPDAPVAAPPGSRTMVADPVQLFRYSALTFNSHRIHYDAPYARDVEGYPGLVVHGPYVATLLLDHALRRHPRARVSAFRFRAMRPIFANDPFTLGLTGRDEGADLLAIDVGGGAAMEARVELD